MQIVEVDSKAGGNINHCSLNRTYEDKRLHLSEIIPHSCCKRNTHKIQHNYRADHLSNAIYQENYEEAVKNLNEAIRLLPTRDTAYNQLAEIYISLKEYDAARSLLQNYLRSNVSKNSEELLDKANELIAQREETERILNELYTAVNLLDIKTITSIMNDSFFKDNIAAETPYYYSPSGNINLMLGYGMLISDENTVYVGGFKNQMKEGIGILFRLKNQKGKPGWYYYQGEWSQNMPNGMGKTGEEITVKDSEGKKQKLTTKVSGTFSYGLENGAMQRIFYKDGEETGRVSYTAVDGIPSLYIDEDGQIPEHGTPDRYIIGEIYLNDEPTGEFYSVEAGTKFKVETEYNQ